MVILPRSGGLSIDWSLDCFGLSGMISGVFLGKKWVFLRWLYEMREEVFFRGKLLNIIGNIIILKAGKIAIVEDDGLISHFTKL